MKCPTCSQEVSRDSTGLVKARVATRIHAERAARRTALRLAELEGVGLATDIALKAYGPAFDELAGK